MIDPPSSCLLLEAQSPGFTAPPINRIGAELMPADVLAAGFAQSQGSFTPRPIRIWLLHDVFVAFEGLVFDRSGQLLAPSATQHHPSEIEWARARIAEAQTSGAVPRIDLPVVLGSKRGAHNYGHWLLEMLPMLHFARQRIPVSYTHLRAHET